MGSKTMNTDARLELRLASDPACLPEARDKIRAWLCARGWEEDGACEYVLALDEALANVIRHGYNNDPSQAIEVAAEIITDAAEGDGVRITVRDYGQQIDPDAICGRDLDDVRPGGLGVHIIRSMTTTATYKRAAGGGMLLIMTKYKSHRATRSDDREGCP